MDCYAKDKAVDLVKYPMYIRQKILKKRRDRRKWQLSRHPNDKKVTNKLIKQLRQSLYKFRNDNIEQYVKNLSPRLETDYSLRRAT